MPISSSGSLLLVFGLYARDVALSLYKSFHSRRKPSVTLIVVLVFAILYVLLLSLDLLEELLELFLRIRLNPFLFQLFINSTDPITILLI